MSKAWWQRAFALFVLCQGSNACLRFGYDASMDAGVSRHDAGARLDAQLPAADASLTRDAGTEDFAADSGSTIKDTGSAAAAADSGSAAKDAGSADAAAESGGPVDSADCMRPGVLFCNGFEEPLPWVPSPWAGHDLTNGTEERSTEIKYASDASAHMSTTSNSSDTAARITAASPNARTSGDLWLRYYYYLPSSVMIDSYFTGAVLSEAAEPYASLSLLIRPGQIQIKSTLLGNKSVGFTFPRDRWVCLEHHVLISATAGIFEIYVDGMVMLTSNTGNSIPSSGWKTADLGIHDVGSNQSPVDVYVDNVVLSTSRYGCD